MSLVTWDNQIPSYNGYFGSIDEVKTVLRSAVQVTQKSSQPDADFIIENAMAACKADLKERCSMRAQDIFPDSIAKYKLIWERAQTRLFSVMYPLGMPAFGYVSIYGTFIDVTSTGYTDTPYVYVKYGVPDAGLFNGQAVNGSFCWDTLHQVMYIQRGTKESTDWQYFDASQLVDFITNPQVLHRAFLYGTAYYLFEGLAGGVMANNEILNLNLYAGQEERYYNKYKEYTSNAMSLLDMDISNGGIITSLDTAYQRGKIWGAV